MSLKRARHERPERRTTDGAGTDLPSGLLRAAALAQGGYLLVTGVWPLVHMRSFEAVTGPKRERWLVKTVGSVLAVVGGVLLDAARRRRIDRTTTTLAVGTAAALTAIDVVYVAQRRISRVYLLDAAAEVGLMGLWAAGLRASRPRARAA